MGQGRVDYFVYVIFRVWILVSTVELIWRGLGFKCVMFLLFGVTQLKTWRRRSSYFLHNFEKSLLSVHTV